MKKSISTTLLSRFLFAFGLLCVALGAIGAFLPLLPTTPFLLLALWAFARSSPKFRDWLWSHELLGPYVRNWSEHRCVPMRAKILAIAMMSLSMLWLVFFSAVPAMVLVPVAAVLGGVAVFLLTRPSAPPVE